MRYHLNLPIMVLAFEDNHQAAIAIPAGAVIEVLGPVEKDDRFLLIRVDAGQFHIFASDLASRAKPISARGKVRGITEEGPAPMKNRAPNLTGEPPA